MRSCCRCCLRERGADPFEIAVVGDVSSYRPSLVLECKPTDLVAVFDRQNLAKLLPK
jgi:hypothetical protein